MTLREIQQSAGRCSLRVPMLFPNGPDNCEGETRGTILRIIRHRKSMQSCGWRAKYRRFTIIFSEFTTAHQSWLPQLRKVDDGSDSQPCSDNKLWDKVFYGLGEMEKRRL
jgi:hypothetical protein